MNNKLIKSFFSSRPFKIIFALIVIAIISTGIVIAIKTIINSVNPPCPTGQTTIQGRKGCYNNICSKKCPQNSHRDFSKQAPECGDCICDDGYKNVSKTSDTLVCKEMCGKMEPCKDGFSCVYFNNELGCYNDNLLATQSQCEENNIYCGEAYTCNADGNKCIQSNPEPPSSNTPKACDSNMETPLMIFPGRSKPTCDDVNGKHNELLYDDSHFNTIRNKHEQPQLAFCKIPYSGGSNNRKCFKKGTSTISYDENKQPQLSSCTKSYPSFDYTNLKNNPNCCTDKPCNTGMCPPKNNTCMPDGTLCSNNNVFGNKDKCCGTGENQRSDEVYTIYPNEPNIYNSRKCPEFSIYLGNTNVSDCSNGEKCQSVRQCINVINDDVNPEQSFQCRAVCGDGEIALDNNCVKTNQCNWNVSSGFGPPEPLKHNTYDGNKTMNLCSSKISNLDDNNTVFWKPFNDNAKENIYTVTANLSTPLNKQTCISDINGLKESCEKIIDGKTIIDREHTPSVDVKINSNTGYCNFDIDCNELQSGDDPNKPWIKQTISSNNLTSVWNKDGTFSQDVGKLLPFNSDFAPINRMFLSNGLYCEYGTLDGITCLPKGSDTTHINNICGISSSPYPNNLNCTLPDGKLLCNHESGNKMTYCCGLGGFAIKDTTNVQCKNAFHWRAGNAPYNILNVAGLIDSTDYRYKHDEGRNLIIPGLGSSYRAEYNPPPFLTSIILKNSKDNTYLNIKNINGINTLSVTDASYNLSLFWGYMPYDVWSDSMQDIKFNNYTFNSVASRTRTFIGTLNSNKIVRLLRENDGTATDNLKLQNPSDLGSVQGIQIICNPNNTNECILVALLLNRHKPFGSGHRVRILQPNKPNGTVQIGRVNDKGDLIFNTEWQTGDESWPSQDILNNTTIFNIELFISTNTSNNVDDNFVKSRSNNTPGFTTVLDLISKKPKISDIISNLQI